MSDAIVLTPAELAAYTARKRPSAQVRVLQFLGIPYKRRPDGSLVVLRVHVTYDVIEPGPEPQMQL